MQAIRTVTAALAALLITAGNSWAWWDTLCRAFRPVPLVQEVEAETCAGVRPGDVREDKQANGGRGGKAVLLSPGGAGLSAEFDLQPEGIYALFAIARSADGVSRSPAKHDQATLRVVEQKTGNASSWTMPIAFRENYFAAVEMYFPANAGGRYSVTVSLTPDSQQALLVDRLELRDALGGLEHRAVKTRRMLTTDDEVARLRAEFARRPNFRITIRDKEVFTALPKRTPAERLKRNDELWSILPDFNATLSHSGGHPYAEIIGRDRPGIIQNASDAYEATGSPEFGWDGAVTLCALAQRYPAIDFFAQSVDTTWGTSNLVAKEPFLFNNAAGKNVYRGWAGGDLARMVIAYDKLFDFIQGNQALADYVGTRIPRVKTPQDVIRLLDVNLLQSGLDNSLRTYTEENDEVKVLIPLVMGVGPLSDRLMQKGIFSQVSQNMTYAGGVDDQAFCSYSRDGVHYIGSVGYVSNELETIAKYLKMYRQAGGPARFDLSDSTRYPQLGESERTLEQLHLCDGFRLLIGDAGDLTYGRTSFKTPYPSRVLGGFGAVVMESGQFQKDPLKMRGFGMHTGIGRGHAAQDTLNLEIFAHGCRMAPDLGGRHEPPRKGCPNMRDNKVHLVVEVDGRNFCNPFPGSCTSATGWTESFSPQPGAQYTRNAARAVSHPYVSIYRRGTALIDADENDSYYFDVFRVEGGSVHTYSFHGPRCLNEDFKINTPLKDAASDVAREYLSEHKEGTRKEGKSPAVLEAEWAIDPALQQQYQDAAYQKDRRPVMRFTLMGDAPAFGHAGDGVFVGNAYSNYYKYEFPFLYIQKRAQGAGLGTVWPAIFEPYAGTPFITSKKRLAVAYPTGYNPVASQEPVAVAVRTSSGHSDILCEGGWGEVHVEGGLTFQGKFGYYSEDADGFRMAHLVGGGELRRGDVSVVAQRQEWQARILSVDYPARTLLADVVLPAALLHDQSAGIHNGNLLHNFVLRKFEREGDRTRITFDKTACFYQSAIMRVDPAGSAVVGELEPPVFGCDTRFADGATVTNEKGDRQWKATLELGDRWMNLGWPGYRGSSPNRLTLDMFPPDGRANKEASYQRAPDADKDGRRTLALLGIAGEKDAAGNSLEGKPVFTIEVTGLDKDGETLYFRLPTEEKWRYGGWSYANRPLVNEDRSIVWNGMYAGSTFRWKLAGAPVTADAFADADGDGKAKMRAYLFGAGDSVRFDTFVYVARQAAGEYLVRANVPCTVTLPGAGAAQASRDGGKSYAPLPTQTAGGRVTLTLDEQSLGAGELLVRMAR